MQESWKFSIPNHLQSKELTDILQELLEKNTKEMGIFLSYYFKKEGAVTENVKLSSDPFFSEKLKGTFFVSFDLVHYNACLNIHEQAKDQLRLNFEFDNDITQLQMTGPYWPEREMDDI
ncbi:hypothetical protein [Shivajiella indica]|uniref:Uncharacterized protein n=1 Tax=Shivajiella indica TaxID=872115 RepID=A0ABW5B5M9_9BACT